MDLGLMCKTKFGAVLEELVPQVCQKAKSLLVPPVNAVPNCGHKSRLSDQPKWKVAKEF